MNSGKSSALAIAIVALLVFLYRKPEGSDRAGQTDSASSPITTPMTIAEPAPAIVHTFGRVQHSSAQDPDQFYNPTRAQEPGYAARVQKHLKLRDYENSPARDTDECVQIVQLLALEGVGLEAVRDTYNAAWDYWSWSTMVDKAADANKEEARAMAEMYRRQGMEKLSDLYGITNSVFFDNLFRITPKVFFGLRNLNLPPGEPLLN